MMMISCCCRLLLVVCLLSVPSFVKNTLVEERRGEYKTNKRRSFEDIETKKKNQFENPTTNNISFVFETLMIWTYKRGEQNNYVCTVNLQPTLYMSIILVVEIIWCCWLYVEVVFFMLQWSIRKKSPNLLNSETFIKVQTT